MLKPDDLKGWLHRRDLKQLDKLLLVLATFEAPASVSDLRRRAREGGLKITATWNPSSTLGRSRGLAINSAKGWELTDAGRDRLRALGVSSIRPEAANVAHDLRAELKSISDLDTRSFAEEAIQCFEFGLYRSSIVMSWVGTVHVLQTHVVAHHLASFNTEATRIDAKWKPAKTTDDLGKMKESDFLDRLTSISVLGKNVKAELVKCLGLRNGCGHPNSMKISANTAANHLEILLLNVFKVFQ